MFSFGLVVSSLKSLEFFCLFELLVGRLRSSRNLFLYARSTDDSFFCSLMEKDGVWMVDSPVR